MLEYLPACALGLGMLRPARTPTPTLELLLPPAPAPDELGAGAVSLCRSTGPGGVEQLRCDEWNSPGP